MGDASNNQGPPETGTHDDIFVTTRWTVVLSAADPDSPQAERAMEEICSLYWFPLYAYIRRRGQSPENAEDLTQKFFQQLLEKNWIADIDREKGRLRAFLITALKRFMANEWRKASAQKRGGGQFHFSIDTETAEGRYASSAKDPGAEAEALFDHEWALTLLELSMQRLKSEYEGAGKAERFNTLKDGLFSPHQKIDYPALSATLNLSVAATQVAVHRLRKRFRELYREAVAQTLPPEADIDEEVRHLGMSLAQS